MTSNIPYELVIDAETQIACLSSQFSPSPILPDDVPNVFDSDNASDKTYYSEDGTSVNGGIQNETSTLLDEVELWKDGDCDYILPNDQIQDQTSTVSHDVQALPTSPSLTLPDDVENLFDSDDSRDKTYIPEDEKSEDSDSDDILSNDPAPNEPIQNQALNVPKKWSRAARRERKLNIHSGKAYVNSSGKNVNERRIKPLKNCRKKCGLVLDEDIRKELFEEYWSLGSHDKRVVFVANLINIEEKQVCRKRKPDSLKEREVTYKYFFEIHGKRVSVCKDCFTKTLDEKEKFIRNVVKNKSQSTSGKTIDDQRGKQPTANKKTEEELNKVRAHIKSFPSHESHYTRRTNDKRYLPSHLNLRIMYDLYKEGETQPVGRTIYEKEFHNMKLSFKKPYVDTCYKCDTLNMEIKVARDNGDEERRIRSEEDLKMHHELANTAYETKKRDKEEAKTDLSNRCYSFDLQQCLPTPYIGSSVAFYKRQLWTFNLTIHDNASGDSYHYMWHEALAARGANEIASCLYHHLKTLPETVQKITYYSDTCGGQNKNSHVAAMFLKAQSEYPNRIFNHKFLVPGHTHMECDVDHSMIEKQKKKLEIPVYHPHDWYQLVRRTGKKEQFHVYEMRREDFFDFAALLKTVLVCRKKNTEGEAFKWHSVQWLQYKDKGVVNYKDCLNDRKDFKVLSFLRRGKTSDLKNISLLNKYTDPFPISVEKKRDLCSLLTLVPPVFHNFYLNLKTSANATDNDPDLVEVDIDGDSTDK